MGKDRLADAIAAAECYGSPTIVIDMGTATTVGVVTAERKFVGGMIIPGVKPVIEHYANELRNFRKLIMGS